MKIFAASAAVDGIGAAGGRPGRRERWRWGAAVLVVVMVRIKSKTNCAPRFVVLFNVAANLFCTVAGFAPMPTAGTVPEGWLAAGQPGGAIPPPLMVYEGTISRFSLQKFFFGFRVALGAVSIG